MAHQHRGPGGVPLTEDAVLGDKLLAKTIEIINYFECVNEDLEWYFENPRAKMRHSPLLADIENDYQIVQVSYCMYATDRLWPKKPTDIFTNNLELKLMTCSKKTPCGDLQETGKTTHTVQVRAHGRAGERVVAGLLERYRIPSALIADIFGIKLPKDFVDRSADMTTPSPPPRVVVRSAKKSSKIEKLLVPGIDTRFNVADHKAEFLDAHPTPELCIVLGFYGFIR
jgi:hypothetical protein